MNYNNFFTYKDGNLYWKIRPTTNIFPGQLAQYKQGGGYMVVRLHGNSLKVHRVIWEMHNGSILPGFDIDHRNGRRSDNRLDNLRMVSTQQNCWNRRISPGRRYKGVHWQKGKWAARIRIGGKLHTLGRFSCELMAAYTYDLTAVRLFGEFAVLNFS